MDTGKPKKSLGQHWLNDQPSLESIVEVAHLDSADTVLEIGPGQGSLTKLLTKKAAKVLAVEIDQSLIGELKKTAGLNLEIVEADIMDFNLELLPSDYKVVANIPYYLTSNLIRKLSEAQNSPKLVVLLVQKEVAERVAAKPGQMSLLAVSAQLYFEPMLGPVVKAELFEPPPKVDSQVIILQRRPSPLFKDLNSRKFFSVVKAGFSERRKKLRSSLAGGLDKDKQVVDKLLKQAGIGADARAQELSLQDWHQLYKLFLSDSLL